MDAVQTLHLITDPTRFRLIQLLFEHHYCVKALARKIGVSEPAISQQMRILKNNHLVQGVKIGYQVHYSVDREKICAALEEVLRQFSAYPAETAIPRDWSCSCELIADCMKRDAKALEEQGYGK